MISTNRCRYDAPRTTAMMLSIPRHKIDERIGTTKDMVAQQLGGDGLLSSWLAALPDHADSLDQNSAAITRDALLDLIAVKLGKFNDQRTRLSSASRLALLKLHLVTDAQLSNSEANRETIAGAAGLSVRHANELLALEGTSLHRLLLERRLLRCRDAFENPAQAGRSISEIAYSWGFTNLTVFGRSFKDAFGWTPSDYRHMHLEPYPPA
jgi:AraC family transcriptional regulator, positive regulator of tynA and feaB